MVFIYTFQAFSVIHLWVTHLSQCTDGLIWQLSALLLPTRGSVSGCKYGFASVSRSCRLRDMHHIFGTSVWECVLGNGFNFSVQSFCFKQIVGRLCLLSEVLSIRSCHWSTLLCFAQYICIVYDCDRTQWPQKQLLCCYIGMKLQLIFSLCVWTDHKASSVICNLYYIKILANLPP